MHLGADEDEVPLRSVSKLVCTSIQLLW